MAGSEKIAVPGKPLPRFLDAGVVSQISLENRLNPGGEGASVNGESWVWSFLKACLAPLVGYDEARAIVQDVQQSIEDSMLIRLTHSTDSIGT